MHQSQRLQLAQDLTAGRVKIQDLSEAEQIAAFGSVFYRSDLLKGEAEGHPFRGNQYTEGSSVRINADQHPLHGRTGRVKRVIPDAGIGGYTPEGKLKTGYEVNVPGVDGDTDIFGEGELEAEGASNEGSSSAQALFDQQNVGGRDSHNSNTPYNTSAGEKAEQGVFLPDGSKNPEYGKPLTAQEQALGMTEAEFNHLDEQGMMNPWGPSKEGQAELKRLRGKTNKEEGLPDHFVSIDQDSKGKGTIRPKTNKWNPKSHSMYHPADYAYLKDKGYSDKEIKAIWDRDHSQGYKPVTVNKDKPNKIYTSLDD